MLFKLIVLGLIVLLVCSVDLSQITLDEATEHLLYFEDSDTDSVDNSEPSAEEVQEPVSEETEKNLDLGKGSEEVRKNGVNSDVEDLEQALKEIHRKGGGGQ